MADAPSPPPADNWPDRMDDLNTLHGLPRGWQTPPAARDDASPAALRRRATEYRPTPTPQDATADGQGTLFAAVVMDADTSRAASIIATHYALHGEWPAPADPKHADTIRRAGGRGQWQRITRQVQRELGIEA